MASPTIRISLNRQEIKQFDHLAIELECSRSELLAKAARIGLPKLKKQQIDDSDDR